MLELLASLCPVTGVEIELPQYLMRVDSTLKLLLINGVSGLMPATILVVTDNLDLDEQPLIAPRPLSRTSRVAI